MKIAALAAAVLMLPALSPAGNLESLSFSNAGALLEAGVGVKALFDEPTEPSAKQKMLDEKLRNAAGGIDVAEIKRLVGMGANPNAYDGYNFTPLTQAVVSHGDLDVLNALLSLGAKADGKGTCDMTALHYAAEYGRLEAAQLLIARGAKVDAPACLGETALLGAVANDKKDVFSYLLAQGADPNLGKDWQGKTALMLAINLFHAAKDNDILNTLLADKRVNSNARDNDGNTALKLAVKGNNIEVVKLLLALPGIDVNDDGGGTTALFLAELNKYDEIAALLKAAGGRSIAAR